MLMCSTWDRKHHLATYTRNSSTRSVVFLCLHVDEVNGLAQWGIHNLKALLDDTENKFLERPSVRITTTQ